MKKIVLKNWPLIAFVFTFAIDHVFGILNNSGLSHMQIEFVKGLGVIAYGKLQLWKNNKLKK